jgi:hypothetical protein
LWGLLWRGGALGWGGLGLLRGSCCLGRVHVGLT